jgi:hypothetical protein
MTWRLSFDNDRGSDALPAAAAHESAARETATP